MIRVTEDSIVTPTNMSDLDTDTESILPLFDDRFGDGFVDEDYPASPEPARHMTVHVVTRAPPADGGPASVSDETSAEALARQNRDNWDQHQAPPTANYAPPNPVVGGVLPTFSSLAHIQTPAAGIPLGNPILAPNPTNLVRPPPQQQQALMGTSASPAQGEVTNNSTAMMRELEELRQAVARASQEHAVENRRIQEREHLVIQQEQNLLEERNTLQRRRDELTAIQNKRRRSRLHLPTGTNTIAPLALEFQTPNPAPMAAPVAMVHPGQRPS